MASMRYPNRLLLKDSNGKQEVRPRPGPCFQPEFCHLLVGDHAVEVTSLSVRVLPGLLGRPPWPLSALQKNQEVMQMPHQASVGEGHHFSPGWGPAHWQSPFYPEESGIKPGPLQGRVEADITPVSPGVRDKPLDLTRCWPQALGNRRLRLLEPSC